MVYCFHLSTVGCNVKGCLLGLMTITRVMLYLLDIVLNGFSNFSIIVVIILSFHM